MAPTKFGVACQFLGSLACAFLIVSLATSNWLEREVGGVTTHVGLFKVQVDNNGNESEDDLQNPDDEVHATRAFTIMAVIASVLAAGFSYSMHKLTPIIFLVAAFCAFLATVIYAGFYHNTKTGGSTPEDQGFDLGYSFVLVPVSMVLCLIGAGISFFAAPKQA